MLVGLSLPASAAAANDYEARIADAQSRAATASGEVTALQTAVAPDRSSLVAAEKRAAPARRRAKSTAAEVKASKRALRVRRLHAASAISQIQSERNNAAEKHDQRMHSDLGLALAALVMAAIALAWGWFRASAAVAYLTRNELKKVLLVVVGIGVISLIIAGSLVGAGGLVAVVGGLILGLSFGLPIAFLLARHSAEVQRGRAKPLLRRERMSPTVTQIIAGAFGVLFLVAVIAGLTDGEAHARSVTDQLRSQIKLASVSSPQIRSDEARVAALRNRLEPLQKTVDRRRASLHAAEHKLHRARARLSDAKGEERRWAHALAALEIREQRQQEREEREYARALEKEQREAEHVMVEEEEAEACDPNYEGACLHDGIGDYDCAGGSGNGPNYVSGPIIVVGADPFGLDANGNGIACEDE